MNKKKYRVKRSAAKSIVCVGLGTVFYKDLEEYRIPLAGEYYLWNDMLLRAFGTELACHIMKPTHMAETLYNKYGVPKKIEKGRKL